MESTSNQSYSKGNDNNIFLILIILIVAILWFTGFLNPRKEGMSSSFVDDSQIPRIPRIDFSQFINDLPTPSHPRYNSPQIPSNPWYDDPQIPSDRQYDDSQIPSDPWYIGSQVPRIPRIYFPTINYSIQPSIHQFLGRQPSDP